MNPIKLILLACYAPRFFADMPPKGGGRYLASAEKYSHFYCHSPHEREVNGRRRAYIAARWLALMLDWNRCTDEVGIRWAITQIPEIGSGKILCRNCHKIHGILGGCDYVEVAK